MFSLISRSRTLCRQTLDFAEAHTPDWALGIVYLGTSVLSILKDEVEQFLYTPSDLLSNLHRGQLHARDIQDRVLTNFDTSFRSPYPRYMRWCLEQLVSSPSNKDLLLPLQEFLLDATTTTKVCNAVKNIFHFFGGQFYQIDILALLFKEPESTDFKRGIAYCLHLWEQLDKGETQNETLKQTLHYIALRALQVLQLPMNHERREESIKSLEELLVNAWVDNPQKNPFYDLFKKNPLIFVHQSCLQLKEMIMESQTEETLIEGKEKWKKKELPSFFKNNPLLLEEANRIASIVDSPFFTQATSQGRKKRQELLRTIERPILSPSSHKILEMHQRKVAISSATKETSSISPTAIQESQTKLQGTATYYGTFRACMYFIKNPNKPAFHTIMTEILAEVDLSKRKKLFFLRIRNALDKDLTMNLFKRWTIKILLPLIYWVASYFSHNLISGLTDYFRTTLIPQMKTSATKNPNTSFLKNLGNFFRDGKNAFKDYAENKTDTLTSEQFMEKAVFSSAYNNRQNPRQADEIFTKICINELMPKLSWTQSMDNFSSHLKKWADNSHYSATKIFKQLFIIPAQIAFWFAKWIIVTPAQAITQQCLNLVAKKVFIETQALSKLIESIRTGQFGNSLYSPIHEWIAARLKDIREVQFTGDRSSVDVATSLSDPITKKTIAQVIKEFFEFLDYAKCMDKEEMQGVIRRHQTHEKEWVDIERHIRQSLVGVIELVQSLLMGEEQLNGYLYEITELANASLINDGRQLGQKEEEKHKMHLENIHKTIRADLQIILQTEADYAIDDLYEDTTQESVYRYIYWLKQEIARLLSTKNRSENIETILNTACAREKEFAIQSVELGLQEVYTDLRKLKDNPNETITLRSLDLWSKRIPKENLFGSFREGAKQFCLNWLAPRLKQRVYEELMQRGLTLIETLTNPHFFALLVRHIIILPLTEQRLQR